MRTTLRLMSAVVLLTAGAALGSKALASTGAKMFGC